MKELTVTISGKPKSGKTGLAVQIKVLCEQHGVEAIIKDEDSTKEVLATRQYGAEEGEWLGKPGLVTIRQKYGEGLRVQYETAMKKCLGLVESGGGDLLEVYNILREALA